MIVSSTLTATADSVCFGAVGRSACAADTCLAIAVGRAGLFWLPDGMCGSEKTARRAFRLRGDAIGHFDGSAIFLQKVRRALALFFRMITGRYVVAVKRPVAPIALQTATTRHVDKG